MKGADEEYRTCSAGAISMAAVLSVGGNTKHAMAYLKSHALEQ
jgi:hypothetical protein